MHSSLQILVPVIVLTASMSHNVIAQHSQFDVKTIEQTTAEFQQATDSIRVKRSHRAAYLGMINAGTLTNAVVDGSGTTIFTFRTIHGVQLDNIVSFGLGIGYERFANATLIPLFLDLRVYIPKGGIAPFLFLDGGHSMATNESGNISSGGTLYDVGCGVRISLTNATSIFLDAGYEFQNTEEALYTYRYENGHGIDAIDHINVSYNLFIVTVGVSF